MLSKHNDTPYYGEDKENNGIYLPDYRNLMLRGWGGQNAVDKKLGRKQSNSTVSTTEEETNIKNASVRFLMKAKDLQ